MLGNTAIPWASRRSHSEAVRILADQGDANPNIADTMSGVTPLS